MSATFYLLPQYLDPGFPVSSPSDSLADALVLLHTDENDSETSPNRDMTDLFDAQHALHTHRRTFPCFTTPTYQDDLFRFIYFFDFISKSLVSSYRTIRPLLAPSRAKLKLKRQVSKHIDSLTAGIQAYISEVTRLNNAYRSLLCRCVEIFYHAIIYVIAFLAVLVVSLPIPITYLDEHATTKKALECLNKSSALPAGLATLFAVQPRLVYLKETAAFIGDLIEFAFVDVVGWREFASFCSKSLDSILEPVKEARFLKNFERFWITDRTKTIRLSSKKIRKFVPETKEAWWRCCCCKRNKAIQNAIPGKKGEWWRCCCRKREKAGKRTSQDLEKS